MELGAAKTSQKFLKRKESLIPASYFSDSPTTFESLRSILSLPSSHRTNAQVDTLVAFSKHLKVFAELRDEISEDAHFQCCQQLSYHFSPAGQFVFSEGEEGTKFYIILLGSCAVITQTEAGEGREDYKQLTVMRQGECFGELALISRMPRAAGVICREDTHFAVLERDDYTHILGKIQDHQLQLKVDLLLRHPVFAKWTKASVQRLSYFFKIRHYKRKHTVFAAGALATEVFLIKTGDFQLTKDVMIGGAQMSTGKVSRSHVDVTVVSAGEILGAKEAIEGGAFAYTCTCSSSLGEAMVILREDFKQVMVSEETVDYLLTLNRAKEQYREDRLKAALEVEQSKRQVLSHKANASLLLHTSRSATLLKNDLMRGKAGIYSPAFDALLDSPRRKGVETQAMMRLGNSSVAGLERLEEKPKPCHSPMMSWGQVFINKYALHKHAAERKRPPEPPAHSKTHREINVRFRQLQHMLSTVEQSKTNLAEKGALLAYGNSLFTISQKYGRVNN